MKSIAIKKNMWRGSQPHKATGEQNYPKSQN